MTEPGRRPDESMSLLNEILRGSREPGYEVAYRRPSRGWERLIAALLVAGLGFGTVVAVQWLRQPSTAQAVARTMLENEILEQINRADSVGTDVARLNEQVDQVRIGLIDQVDPALLEQFAADRLTAGAIPVTGPGLRIVLNDSLAARLDPDGAPPASRVQDSDLRTVVNGLWQSGAEAIAINGIRLTALSAIRSAGQAILVDLIALNAPYVVDVICDAASVQTDFARTPAAAHLKLLETTYGIGTDVSVRTRLDLPGAGLRLTNARPMIEGDGG